MIPKHLEPQAGYSHVARDLVPGSSFLGNDGSQTGKPHGRILSMPRDQVVDCLGVADFLRMHRADDGQFVHLFSCLRQ